MLLSEAWEAFEVDKRLEGYSKYTLQSYRLQSKLLIDYLGDKELDEVSYFDLKRYYGNVAKRLKPSSVDARMKYARSLYKWAQDEGYIMENPTAKLKPPKQGQRLPKYLTEEELERIRVGCKTKLENALFEFFFATGCRVGEVHGIEKSHIDWHSRSVIVKGKGDKEREVYFSTRAEIWLRNYLNSRTDDDPALFVTERRPIRRMSIAQIRWVLKRVARRTGIEKSIYPHRLRHSFATHMLNNGAPMEAVQDFLGHSKQETTRVYAQLTQERRREIYRRHM